MRTRREVERKTEHPVFSSGRKIQTAKNAPSQGGTCCHFLSWSPEQKTDFKYHNKLCRCGAVQVLVLHRLLLLFSSITRIPRANDSVQYFTCVMSFRSLPHPAFYVSPAPPDTFVDFVDSRGLFSMRIPDGFLRAERSKDKKGVLFVAGDYNKAEVLSVQTVSAYDLLTDAGEGIAPRVTSNILLNLTGVSSSQLFTLFANPSR